MRTIIIQSTWLAGLSTKGWGNGYVIIPPKHPFHGKDYDEINNHIDVHGGLTFAAPAKELDWKEIAPEDIKGWVVGFDTAHYGDTEAKWSKEAVQAETDRLQKQIEKYKPKLSKNARKR